MNIVLITGKRSMRNLDTVLKKSEQAVTVGKYTSVRPNTATEIYEKYRPHGIMNTETAGNPDFSGLPAFFVTNLLLVQCSI